ncbi:MAG: DinB family protein [Chloroflexota bacterium]
MSFFAELSAVLSTTPHRWHQLTEHTPLDALRRQPAHGEWSALEVLLHLIDMERDIFPVRVRAMLAGQDFPAFFPDEDGSTLSVDANPAAMAAEFADLRHTNLDLLATVTEADLTRTSTHEELGTVTLKNLLCEWGGHDLMHMMQANQALLQPYITGSGPWLPYFEKHLVASE